MQDSSHVLAALGAAANGSYKMLVEADEKDWSLGGFRFVD